MKPLIIIPTINERKNIKELIPQILNLKENFEILVVDDGSADGTQDTVKELSQKIGRIYLLERKGKKGLGKSYIDGFKWALERNYDLVFEMDADGSHSPEFLPKFLEKIKDCDLVVGSRYINGKISVVNWDIKRILLSLTANWYARIITGVSLSDLTSGFKCIKKEVLEKINLDEVISEGYSFQIEINWRAYKAGFKVGEIPIIFYERKHGKSKLSSKIIWEGFWLFWRIRLSKFLNFVKIKR